VVREVVREVPVEVVREVVREVPVEVVREVVREVPVEIIKEVVKEVPVEVLRDLSQVDDQEMQRLRRRLEEMQTQYDQLVTMSGRVPIDEKMQALLTMASGIGHIFNNVLAGILGRTQLLLKKAEREKQRDLINGLTEIEAATRTGIDALARIQEFSRARPSEALARVDLNDVVQRAIEQTRPKWRDEPAGKGVRVELITHFGAHAPVLGVETELLEALNQLIVNAVDAMPRGGTITIRTGNEPGRGFMTVSDNGVGMAENVRRRAFEPFFSTKGETGLGLGLSVVYGIMVRHGGDAVIESEAGKGSTLTVSLPTAPEGPVAQPSGADTDQAQVLVVDDDETVRTALGDMLRGAGYGVTLAASGLEGIAKVREREGPFHLVVTDLGMPDVPGWEVVEAVKQVETATPVVIMSGFDRARATRRAKELGVDLVISKPFDLQDFLNAVRGLLLGRKRS
jgi:signal transduction histidine kinase/ActR/RegA family two-component response regulator